jgi:translation initiation factor 2B subunit (eIF-2B alpha/beta/delta family)
MPTGSAAASRPSAAGTQVLTASYQSGVAMEVVWDLLIFLALVAVGLVVLRVLSDSR